MARVALAGIMALVVGAAASAAATLPAYWLRDGQTRYLLPSQAHPGVVVRCTAGGRSIDAAIPDLPAAGGMAGGTDTLRGGGPPISIDRRPNGATEIRCGSATAGTGSFARSPDPYVIGQNGLDLIRGRNRLSVLEKVYGSPRVVSGSRCRVAWRAIGLVATFGGGRCTKDSVLVGAVVQGLRWHSLSGVRVGDSVAKLLWEAQSAKPLAHGRWLLASGGASHHARLVAVTSVGAVVRLELTGS